MSNQPLTGIGRRFGHPRVCTPIFVMLGLLVWLVPSPAHAGDDPGCILYAEGYPPNGAEGVVRNTMVVIEGSACSEASCPPIDPHVMDASDNEIRFDMGILEDCIPVFFPREPLAPNAQYCVQSQYNCFRTGTEIDDTPPELTLGSDDSGEGLRVPWTGSPDIVLFTMQIRGGLISLRGIGVSASNPLVAPTWAEEDGSRISITAYDRAGHSTAQVVTLRSPEGCQTGGGGTSIWAALLLGLVMVMGVRWRRRRG